MLAETQIITRLVALSCPQSSLALFAEFSATKLSRGLRANGNGPDALTPADGEHLLKTLDEVEKLAASVAPLPIDWRQTGIIAQVLQQRRKNRVFKVYGGGGVFADGKGPRPVFDSVGIALTGEVAHRTCERLRTLGYQGVVARQAEVETGTEIFDDFYKLWRL